jgi:iron complex outermembrane receptor protein
VSNIFDEAPPAVTRSTGEFERVGNSAFYSQYDWLGRRAFVNVTGSF